MDDWLLADESTETDHVETVWAELSPELREKILAIPLGGMRGWIVRTLMDTAPALGEKVVDAVLAIAAATEALEHGKPTERKSGVVAFQIIGEIVDEAIPLLVHAVQHETNEEAVKGISLAIESLKGKYYLNRLINEINDNEKLIINRFIREFVPSLDDKIKEVFLGLPKDAEQRLEAVANRVDAFRVEATPKLQDAINAYLCERAKAQGPGSSVGRRHADDRLGYAEKEKIADTVNSNLERLGLAIDYRGHACNFAVTGGAKHGRFLLVPKGSKTPLLTRVNLSDFLPLTLVDASPRREGLVEWQQQEQGRRQAAAQPAVGRE